MNQILWSPEHKAVATGRHAIDRKPKMRRTSFDRPVPASQQQAMLGKSSKDNLNSEVI